jgi:hypothetical protein
MFFFTLQERSVRSDTLQFTIQYHNHYSVALSGCNLQTHLRTII